jgi:hypothetical protein
LGTTLGSDPSANLKRFVQGMDVSDCEAVR